MASNKRDAHRAAQAFPKARDIMTRRVDTVSPDDPIDHAVGLVLLKRGHSGAPVVDADGSPVGVLSEHDCIRVLARAATSGWPTGKVADHMTNEVETVSPTEDVLVLSERFVKGRMRRLLVVEDGHLVGLVSRRDLLQALQSLELGAEKARPRTTYELIAARHRSAD